MKQGDKGPQIKKLQQDLILLGYDLPRWGADADLGDETLGAALEFLEDRGFLPASTDELQELSDIHVRLITQAAEEKRRGPARPASLVDCTGRHAGSKRKGPRDWKTITSIVLHQTDCVLGERPERWFNVPVHLGATRGGQIILLNPLNQLLYHANALNKDSIGIEIDGHYEGIEGDIRTYNDYDTGRKPQKPTPEGIQAARLAVDWICDEVKANGGLITEIWAHRQGSNTRQRDPGSHIWKEVALWAEEQGLAMTSASFVRGKGQPIPQAWDPRSTAKY